jgi:hypothetical protein
MTSDYREAGYLLGQQKARELRAAAPNMTDTEVLDNEQYIPEWRAGKQKIGAPVMFEGNGYRTLQTHDSTYNESWTPYAERALFGLMHTKNPAKAKPWVAPLGISGMYAYEECYVDENGVVWQQLYDGMNEFPASALPERWKAVGTLKDGVYVPY